MADDGSGEDRLIARYFKPLAKDPAALDLTDDVAVFSPPPGCDLVVTADAVVGGVHFFDDDPAAEIAKKALRVNLSDLASKGARPLGFIMTIALPRRTSEDWIGDFAAGLAADAEAYACPLLGGDTTATPGPLMISITALGTVPQGRLVKRSGARIGDEVVVTGSIGDAALGLYLRRDGVLVGHREGVTESWSLPREQTDYLEYRYRLPQPRLGLAAALLRHATAAMDVSDGLAGDLAKLCRTSGISAEIDVDRVPLSEAARAALVVVPQLRQAVLSGGDDYEILATVPQQKITEFRREAVQAGVAVTSIGRITAGHAPPVFFVAGQPFALTKLSYSHF